MGGSFKAGVCDYLDASFKLGDETVREVVVRLEDASIQVPVLRMVVRLFRWQL